MKTRSIAFLLALTLMLTTMIGCTPKPKEETAVPAAASVSEAESPVETAEPVTLRVVSAWTDFPALEAVATLFTEKYSNCTIEYEYLQDYYASLEKRLNSGEAPIDLFVTTNIQADSALLPYALDLYSAPLIHFDNAFAGLNRNFEFRGTVSGEAAKLYAAPLGAELRGLYVNKTLLDTLGIAVPTSRTELLSACDVLKEHGYIPLHGNPGSFAQQLMYPYCCNIIANAADYEAVYRQVDDRTAGCGALFTEPMQLLYTMVEKGYYNYKLAETEQNLFKDASNDAYARNFLNIVGKDDVYTKVDDVGIVAFMPSTMSLESTISKMKSDYHSEIDYTFILAPVGEDGGYAYMSPAHGIAINKNSVQLEWAERFMDFLFTPEVNRIFAEKHSIIPNTQDAFAQIESQFHVPENHISHLGEVTFRYNFFGLVNDSLVEVAKANNPKYMMTDENGNSVMYDFAYYMERLEQRLTDTLPAE